MEKPIVETQSGFIRGLIQKHEEGFEYYAFRGVPYAEPPLGELRFEDPIPKKSWTDILDCFNYRSPSLQHDCLHVVDSFDEDCLHLNVFTRSIDLENESNPVIFIIHGGGFIIGSSDDLNYGPEYLIRKNVVLVLVNYRLGALGFLNLEDEVAPGNQGLKDLLLALQWVQQNIRQFGGDPDNVTLMGCAAGGVAAHYLALSPLAKGLMHKVICQGGVIHNLWFLIDSPRAIAIKLCSVLGKYLTDSKEIVQFLKGVSVEQLHDAQETLREIIVYSHTFPFGPGRDDKSSNPLMPMDPIKAASQGTHLPFIVGCNSHEGIILLNGMSRSQFFEMCNIDFDSILLYNTADVFYRYNLDKEKVKRMYYKNENISQDNEDIFVRLTTDLNIESFHRFSKIQFEKSSASTYYFVFSYESPKSLINFMVENRPAGCSHLDDLPYFFKTHAFENVGIEYFEKGSKDYRVMEQVTEMWANFARYGRPTIETSDLIPVHWTPINDGKVIRYLNIDNELTMQSMVNIEQKLLSLSK